MVSAESTSSAPTFGVEEEFLLVDPVTGEPAPRNSAVATEAETRGVTLQLELSSCQVETNSSVARTSAQLGAELAGLRRTAAQAAQGVGVQLLALALPPVTPHSCRCHAELNYAGRVRLWARQRRDPRRCAA